MYSQLSSAFGVLFELCREPRQIARSVVLIAVLSACASANAAGDGNSTSGSPASTPAATTVVSKPATTERTWTYGFEERVRTENWDDITDFTPATADERHQVRFRTRMFTSVTLPKGWSFSAGLANEFKRQTTPDINFNMDEVFVETLYIEKKSFLVPKLTMRVGRQPISRGDGFIIYEGTPGDGSRSLYFNALSLTYGTKAHAIELLGILDPKTDRFMPLIHSQHKYLQEWDEQAVGLYYTERSRKNTDIDAYWFLKKEIHDYRAPSNAQFQPDRHVHTIGARVVQRLTPQTTLSGEAAVQAGNQYPSTEIRGWAASSVLKHTFNGDLKPYVQTGFFAMSGDDPKTSDRIEGWDPIFSRYPKWSEAIPYTLGKEKGQAYWTNLLMPQVEAGFTAWKKLSTRGTWYYLGAFQPYVGSTKVFSTGKNRGNIFEVRSDLDMGKGVKAHVMYETLHPGDFYTQGHAGYFMRAEVSYQFKQTRGF